MYWNTSKLLKIEKIKLTVNKICKFTNSTLLCRNFFDFDLCRKFLIGLCLNLFLLWIKYDLNLYFQFLRVSYIIDFDIKPTFYNLKIWLIANVSLGIVLLSISTLKNFQEQRICVKLVQDCWFEYYEIIYKTQFSFYIFQKRCEILKKLTRTLISRGCKKSVKMKYKFFPHSIRWLRLFLHLKKISEHIKNQLSYPIKVIVFQQ